MQTHADRLRPLAASAGERRRRPGPTAAVGQEASKATAQANLSPQVGRLKRLQQATARSARVGTLSAVQGLINGGWAAKRALAPVRPANLAQAPVQRVLSVGGITITKHNFRAHCLTPGGKCYAAWQALGEDGQRQLMPIIEARDKTTVSSFQEAMDALTPEGGEGGAGASTLAPGGPATRRIAWKSGEVDAEVISDAGGYHLILQHPERPDLIIRQRKSGATPIKEGLRNLSDLSEELRKAVGRAVRVPHVEAGPGEAYTVEKVTGVVDALELWNRLKALRGEGRQDSREFQDTRARLQAIAELFQRNIRAAASEEQEPFPDFRPANVGYTEGRPELVYIDFDQRGEIKDRETLIDQAMEWAGRRYVRDPGGARAADPELFKFITGGQLGKMARGEETSMATFRGGAGASLPLPSPSVGGGASSMYEPLTGAASGIASMPAPSAVPATADATTWPGVQILPGAWGSGGIRIAVRNIPEGEVLRVGETVIVYGQRKRIHHTSRYEDNITADFVPAD